MAVCVAITALLGAWLTHRTRPDWVDAAVDARVQASLGGHPLLPVLVQLGGPVPVTVMIAALVLACIVWRRYRKAALVAISVPAAAAITERLLKPLIGRTPAGSLSFPSGHATGVFALAAAAALLLSAPLGTAALRALRLLLSFTAFLIATAVAVALIGQDIHDFTDTVAGAAVGIGTALLTALILDLLRSARRNPHERLSLAGTARHGTARHKILTVRNWASNRQVGIRT